MLTRLELLSPAGNIEIGKAAIDHGADAVYVGAPQFSARAQANQTIEEISELINYAHLFHCRIYVALNTILTDQEMPMALDLIRSLDRIGADGLIIQDMGLLEMNLPPIPLIASTQMHIVTAEKVQFLEKVGFDKVVLARELSLAEIAAIRAQTSVEIEVFIHGALCVSYSGQCYMSQVSFGRSANRGVCSQPCRHAYTLKDGEGKIILRDKHLLCLKDMNRMGSLADLIAAGATSFKIEGRYKDINYVKNITAAYRLALDSFIAAHPTYTRAGSGSCTFTFQPDPEKTFNRGYTDYFLKGDGKKIASLSTPKSMGQCIGKVNKVGQDFFQLDKHDLVNGDGLCFLTDQESLDGCRVDTVKEGRVYPNSMRNIMVGTVIFRNFDAAFVRTLKQSGHCRTIGVTMAFCQEEKGVGLKIEDEDGISVEYWYDIAFEQARDPVQARSTIENQLRRTGETPYRVDLVTVQPELPGFLPISTINDIRRQALSLISHKRIQQHRRVTAQRVLDPATYPETEVDYHANVANAAAETFYIRHGAQVQEKALEVSPAPFPNQIAGREVMTTRYCLRYQLDACLKSKTGHGKKTIKPPLIISDQGHEYRLEFACRECKMLVIPENAPERMPESYQDRKKFTKK